MPHEDYVRNFCKVCDHYREGLECPITSESQEIYAGRNFCGWASIEGTYASITLEKVAVGLFGQIFDREDEETFRKHFRTLTEKKSTLPVV